MKYSSEIGSMALVAICVCLNLGLGVLVSAIRLPLYLDSVGTVLATALGGLWVGILSGVLSVVIGSAYTPTLWAYAGTMAVIAVYVSFVRPFGYLSKPLPTLLFGIGLGVVCAIISAPVTTYVWKGVSLSGTDAVTSFFSAKGGSLLLGVVLGGLVTDPIDKLVTSFAVLTLLRAVPVQCFSKQANPL
jgi:energy-coupling factor transport system substrate-specific component